jgi:hypothetical protein
VPSDLKGFQFVAHYVGGYVADVAHKRCEMGGTGLEPVTPSLSSWCSPN